jgi:hypothetical protein
LTTTLPPFPTGIERDDRFASMYAIVIVLSEPVIYSLLRLCTASASKNILEPFAGGPVNPPLDPPSEHPFSGP